MTVDPEPQKKPDSEDAAKSADAKATPEAAAQDMSGASFWDESQIQQVIRHAGQARRSPKEFFNKKWKEKFIHQKPEDEAASAEDDASPKE